MTPAPKKKKRVGSKLVRLNDPTLELLEQLRKSSMRHYAGLDAFVYQLAIDKAKSIGLKFDREVRGIPRRSHLPANRNGVTPTPTPARSPADGPAPIAGSEPGSERPHFQTRLERSALAAARAREGGQ